MMNKHKIISVLSLVIVCFIVFKIFQLQYNDGYIRKYSKLSVKEQYRELDCLTENVYYEATGEPLEGMLGVAQVTLNRVESGKFANTVCKVVHQKYQFSWTMDKPKALVKINKAAWDDAREVAKKVLLEGERLDSLTKALYYHTTEVNPVWNRNMKMVKHLGHHLFFEETK